MRKRGLMSIKINKFNNEIIPLWNEIQDIINGIDEKQVPESYIENFAYLRKIAAFLLEAMSCIDADYLPTSLLSTISGYLNDLKNNLKYSQNYSNQYIQNVESNLDNLLQIIFPFVLHKGKAIKGLREGLNDYSKTITNHIENDFLEIKSIKDNSNGIKAELKNNLNEFERLRTEIEDYRDLLFLEDGIKESIEKLLNSSKSKLSDIEGFHNSIYEKDGLKQEIDEFYSNISDKNKKINELNEDCSITLQELSDFYDKIFGKDDADGKKIGGLKQEIEQRKSDFDEFGQYQQKKYDELNKKIESLLPGATSVGLSSAYHEMRNKFSDRAVWYGRVFYLSLIVLSLVIYSVRNLSIIQEIPLDKGLGISLLSLFGNFAVKLPFIFPALWFVIFVSKRRSEAERLAQEYTHKESLAKSYDSYKHQIDELSEKNKNELLPILMENMIKAIALNPAETLDKKHKSDSPVSEILKDKSIIDNLNNLFSKSK